MKYILVLIFLVNTLLANNTIEPNRFKSKFEEQRNKSNSRELNENLHYIKYKIKSNYNKLKRIKLKNKVLITVNRNGKMRYKILEKSGFRDFDKKIKNFLKEESKRKMMNTTDDKIEIIMTFKE